MRVKKVQGGSALMSSTNSLWTGNEQRGQVADLVGEIAAAFKEQTQATEQEQGRFRDVEVTRQNAAEAQESASAFEEMNAQAATMKSLVNVLVAMIGAQEMTTSPPQA